MAITSNTYTGNGTNKLFSITFPYLDTSDINVYLNGVLQTITTQYTFANATTVEFVTAPSNGASILLDRSTDDTALQATFFPGSSIKADDLNFNFDQVLYLAQETANSAANQSTAGLQTQITAATNTANNANTTANTANATANAANTTANGIAGTANTALTTANAAETTANGIAATANTALSNSNTAISTANAAVATANAAAQIVRGTAQATTSGTAVDFTGIPSWVKRLTVVFTTLSQSGSAYVLFQLGDSGGVETTGYTSTANFLQGGTSSGTFSSTAGIVLLTGSTLNQITGSVVFNNINSNTWVATGMYNYNNATGITGYTAGDKTLSNTLDRIRITSTNGTDTFDAGMVNIIYEG